MNTTTRNELTESLRTLDLQTSMVFGTRRSKYNAKLMLIKEYILKNVDKFGGDNEDAYNKLCDFASAHSTTYFCKGWFEENKSMLNASKS